MEQTIGKRIAAGRKKLGLTQDAMAEKLGVTAQAVSKWENDQSCPDITMIPRLAQLFGISTDELLGVEHTPVYEGHIVEEEEEPGIRFEMDGKKMFWSVGRKGSLSLAVWVLLVGGLLLASSIIGWDAGFWGILWPTGLLTFGIFGLLRKFSFLRIGCALFGCYFTLSNLGFAPFLTHRKIIFPVLLLLIGMSLLMDAFGKKGKSGIRFTSGGKKVGSKHYEVRGDRFECSASFSELDQLVLIPRLAGGSAEVSFGELELDLTGCEEIAPRCVLDVSCNFGEVTVRVPGDVIVEQYVSSSFGSVEVKGSHREGAARTLILNGSVSFGEVTVEYV